MNEPGFSEELLRTARVIAVVGYSADQWRTSNSVSRTLRARGYRVIPVNPLLKGSIVDGEQSFDRVQDVPDRVDFVDVFRRGEFLDAVVDDTVAAKVPAIWFQLDLGNVAAAERAERLGLRVVWNRCTAIEVRSIPR